MLRRMILLVALLCTMLLSASPAVAQEALWTEGAYVNIEPYACGLQSGGFHALTMTGSKFVDRVNGTRASNVNMYLTNGITPAHIVYTLIGPVTVELPGDPDNLSVSRDLGWAGLDTTVSAFNAATNAMVTVDIHLSWFANGSVVQEGSLYKRTATISGTINLTGYDYNYLLPACIKTGYIFSTREPKPRY